MSDKTEDRPEEVVSADSGASESKESKAPRTDGGAAETRAPEAAERSAAEVAPVKRPSSVAGILALLIALAAAGGVGYVWYEQQSLKLLEARVAELGRDLEQRGADLGRALASVDELKGGARDLGDDISDLATHVQRDLDGVPDRLGRLETAVENVSGISQQARSAWLRSEAEYFLRVANVQLNLAGNVGVALRALELADEQLRNLADPALTPVRDAISKERVALKAVPQPDVEGIVLKLGSLAGTLGSLPFANRAPGGYRGAQAAPTEETGWRRAWQAIVAALKSIISVKRDDQNVTPLFTDAEEALLIRSLDVDLQIAQVAVIRNEGELYRSTLDSVGDRLRRSFDTSSPAVAAVLSTLSELEQVQLPGQLPDISASLRLLQNAPGGVAAQ